MNGQRKLIYALLVAFICGILANAGMYVYVGYAIEESHRPLCRLTVKIEDAGRASGQLMKEVEEMNRDYNCRRLVK